MAWSGANPEEDAISDQIQPWPVVQQGSQGHPVPALQYLLRDRGHHVTVDGIVGPLTWRALVSGMLSF
jgi:peptidoglycan hydrolase-like protein with peptidoglycan-binding domain